MAQLFAGGPQVQHEWPVSQQEQLGLVNKGRIKQIGWKVMLSSAGKSFWNCKHIDNML